MFSGPIGMDHWSEMGYFNLLRKIVHKLNLSLFLFLSDIYFYLYIYLSQVCSGSMEQTSYF